MSSDPRYPVGPEPVFEPVTVATRRKYIDVVAELPAGIRAAVGGLTATQLETPYRAGGWTVRQVVHHLADSHMHAFMRLKWALAEDAPTIKPYDERVWAELPDSAVDIGVSLGILDGVHARWLALYRGMDEARFGRAFIHPERGRLTLDHHLHIYAWHSRHHVAHVTELRRAQGW
jgi:DinB superfamily